MSEQNRAEKQTARGNAPGIIGIQYLTAENKAYVRSVLTAERIREANMSTFDAFASPQCRPRDLMNSGRGVDVTARNCRAADYIEKKIWAEENKRFNRKMLVEDLAAGVFATLGIVFMLSIAYGLFYGAL